MQYCKVILEIKFGCKDSRKIVERQVLLFSRDLLWESVIFYSCKDFVKIIIYHINFFEKSPLLLKLFHSVKAFQRQIFCGE